MKDIKWPFDLHFQKEELLKMTKNYLMNRKCFLSEDAIDYLEKMIDASFWERQDIGKLEIEQRLMFENTALLIISIINTAILNLGGIPECQLSKDSVKKAFEELGKIYPFRELLKEIKKLMHSDSDKYVLDNFSDQREM